MRVMHLIESMGHGGAEWLIVEHVRHAGPGVESLVCAINRGGAALESHAPRAHAAQHQQGQFFGRQLHVVLLPASEADHPQGDGFPTGEVLRDADQLAAFVQLRLDVNRGHSFTHAPFLALS